MDISILIWINNYLHGAPWVSHAVKWFTYLGNAGWIWILLCVILLCFKKTRYGGITLAVALIFDVLIINVLLKNVVNRPRPWTEYPAFQDFYHSIGLSLPTDSSFPSGHAAVSLCAATVLVMRYRAKGIAAAVVAVLIALSRLYLCVHYPTDVLAGALIGSAIGIGATFATDAVAKKIKQKIQQKKQIKNENDT